MGNWLANMTWIEACGWIGNGCCFLRFLLQWWASEKAGRSVAPRSFWVLSILASIFLFVYTAHEGEPVLLLGYLVVTGIYVRNMFLPGDGVPHPDPEGGDRLGPIPAMAVGLGAGVLLLASGLVSMREKLLSSPGWLAAGILGQVLWSSRFLLQWYHSERVGRSHFPRSFWWVSLMGNALLLAYTIHLGKAVWIAGYLPGPLVQIRNLMLRPADPSLSTAQSRR